MGLRPMRDRLKGLRLKPEGAGMPLGTAAATRAPGAVMELNS